MSRNIVDLGQPCDNCGFKSELTECRGYHICGLCVAWLEYDPSRHLKCEREKIIAKIEEWQRNHQMHKFYCGNNSRHASLQPKDREDRVVLTCPDCDYVQRHIPDIILKI